VEETNVSEPTLPPKVTVALLVKLLPMIVTDVPPDGGPEEGEMLEIEGTKIVIVIEFELEALLVPNALDAFTVKTYVSPAVNELNDAVVAGGLPDTVTGVRVELVVVSVPVTVYEMILAPPSLVGALQLIVAVVF
jgi:hypothetical protein